MSDLAIARRRRLLHVVTVPQTFALLEGQTTFMANHGFDVTGISSAGPFQEQFRAREPVTLLTVEMPRRITPVQDVVALAHLVRAIRRVRPDIVHAHTPKGGLLGVIAAWLAGVPLRVYHMRGLPLMTATGSKRAILATTERISCRLASRVLCVSHSLRQYAIDEGLCSPDKIVTLLGGTGNGVDADGRFNPDLPVGDLDRRRAELRGRLEIPDDALVVGFVGRVVRDKGVVELAAAWTRVAERFPSAHLIMAGPAEPQDPVPPEAMSVLETHPRVHLLGQTNDARAVYAASDVVTLPTYREGLPNVPLEAGALRRPVVATRIPGCVDAVVDGETGLLVPVGDASSLAHALERYLGDETLRERHGRAGRERVRRDFDREAIWTATLREYEKLLAERRVRGHVVQRAAKRLLDIVVSALVLVVASPLLLVVALAVRATMGTPVLFRQQRPGKRERPFLMTKFRTMRDATDAAGRPLPDGERLTAFGAWLRKTSIDELPELWNVLGGDMSLVGPRPLLMRYLPWFTDAERLRFSVRPGITGLAQVSGRNEVRWSDRLSHDVDYVERWSLLLDMKILMRTVGAVFGSHGVVVDANSIMLDLDQERQQQAGLARQT